MRPLAPEIVEPLLNGGFGRPYLYAERCASTQLLLPSDAPEGAVAVAEQQTAGRGRLGRRWTAPPRTSILASIVLRPRVPARQLPELSLVAGDAVATALSATVDVEPTVKSNGILTVMVFCAVRQIGPRAAPSQTAKVPINDVFT